MYDSVPADEGPTTPPEAIYDRQCKICDKFYKNKKSLNDHKRRYHFNIPLRLYADQQKDSSKSQPADKDSEIDTNVSNTRKSRKRHSHDALNSGTDVTHSSDLSSNWYSDSDTSLHSTRSYEKRKRDRTSSIDVSRKKINDTHRPDSQPRISSSSKKRSISPDTGRIIKKLKRKDKEESVRRILRRERKMRQRKVRKRLRRKVVNPKDVEPLNTDEEVDNDADEDQTVDDTIGKVNLDLEKDSSDNSESDNDEGDVAKYVNCISIEDFEKVRKSIKNYNIDSVISDTKDLHVIQTLFKGILNGWIPICTSQKQMFSRQQVKFIRKVGNSKIIDLNALISENKEELEKIFSFVDKSIKLVVEAYNKFGIIDKAGNPK